MLKNPIPRVKLSRVNAALAIIAVVLAMTVLWLKTGGLDTATLNSLDDGPFGNEARFMAVYPISERGEHVAYEPGQQPQTLTVENGQRLLLRVAVHNSNPAVVAEDVMVALSVPTETNTSIEVLGLIQASNATPDQYQDSVTLTSETPFHLEYAYGTARLENSGIGGGGGIPLGDEIVTRADEGGVVIGYDALDGKLPGGEDYVSYVSCEVFVIYDANFKVQQTARLEGELDWDPNGVSDVKVGDVIQFQTEYQNWSDEVREHVVMTIIWDEGLEFVPGSVLVYNTLYPDGNSVSDPTLRYGGDGYTAFALDLGSYATGANVYLRFSAVVTDANADSSMCLAAVENGGVALNSTTAVEFAK